MAVQASRADENAYLQEHADAEDVLMELHACQRDMRGARHEDTLATMASLAKVLRAHVSSYWRTGRE